MIQMELDFRPEGCRSEILLQCPFAFCRKTFWAAKTQVYYWRGSIPFIKCPCCRKQFNVTRGGKLGQPPTLLEGTL
jgi:hypothetical protein